MEYSKPAVVDYGTLKQVTATGGGGFVDLPMGVPNVDSGPSS
jgi:hypothetical protein